MSVLRRLPLCAPDTVVGSRPRAVVAEETPIIPTVDPVLRPLLPTFLMRRRQDVTLIKQELKREGFRAIETIGHNLKGIGSSYGFHGISDIGKAMEQASQVQDPAAIRQLAQELDDYLRRVRLEPE